MADQSLRMQVSSTPLPNWASQLAGILPLSALIDFLNTPKVFHIFQLRGAIPIWCWPITPSASRLLLAKHRRLDACWLDKYENGNKPICLDGRYGDQYFMANAETIRIALERTNVIQLKNEHPNVAAEAQKRPQYLEVVLVSRLNSPSAQEEGPQASRTHTDDYTCWRLLEILGFVRHPQERYYMHNCTAILGWLLWISCIVFSGILHWWLALSFLFAVGSSGICVLAIHGSGPRYFGHRDSSPYARVVVSADHVNATDWKVFYGASSTINSILNWTLLPQQRPAPHWLWYQALRILTFCQWALAIGAAARQSWDAYLVAFWILFCVFAINFVFCTERAVSEWISRCEGIKLQRLGVYVSSRRALLNAIIALSPDTLLDQKELDEDGYARFSQGGLLWLDPILKASAGRDAWLEATRKVLSASSSQEIGWKLLREEYRTCYWWKFVEEGTQVAETIKGQISALSQL